MGLMRQSAGAFPNPRSPGAAVFKAWTGLAVGPDGGVCYPRKKYISNPRSYRGI